MSKELVFPQGVKIVDGLLYFGDRQVSCNGQPYKFANVRYMCTKFAIRYTNSRTSYPTLCTTLDLIPAVQGSGNQAFIWLCSFGTVHRDKTLPSAYYTSWESVEHVLNTFAEELQGSEWFIEVDDENYRFDNERGVFRKQIKIETVEYLWADEDDDEPEYDSAGFTEADR